jgi:hypothetical protein
MAAWMIPAGIAVGTAAGQLLSSYYGGKKGQEASQAAMDEAARQRAGAYGSILGMPDYLLPEYSPELQQYDYLAGPTPIDYVLPEEVTARTIAEDPATRQLQWDALQELSGRAEEGLSAQDRYNFMNLRRQADEAARGRELAVMEDLARRGMGGTGIEAAMRTQAGQAATDRLAQSMSQQAAANAQKRLQATQAVMTGAGQLRGADIGKERTNADILNNMAWKNSERARMINNANIQALNELAKANVSEQRRIGAINTAQANQLAQQKAQYEIDRKKQEISGQREKQQMLAQEQLGSLPGIYAQGAADAGRQQQLWGTVGQTFPTAANVFTDIYKAQGTEKPAVAASGQTGTVNNYYGGYPQRGEEQGYYMGQYQPGQTSYA